MGGQAREGRASGIEVNGREGGRNDRSRQRKFFTDLFLHGVGGEGEEESVVLDLY